MKDYETKNYITFWLSQSISQLGSSMTSFALILWVYKQTNSVMAVSLLTFFSYLPYIVVSIFAGTYVDTHKKKFILLWADSIACICSVSVLILLSIGKLEIPYIYIANLITGFMNGFQSPASTVAIGMLVPKEKYSMISGLNSFSNSLITVVTPMLAAFISSFLGLKGVLFIDMLSFSVAFLSLLFFIKIPELEMDITIVKKNIIEGCMDGFKFLSEHRGLLNIILSLAMMNFFSRLTYENILAPMILSRSGGNNQTFGLVCGIIGLGGIIGGLIVSIVKLPKDNIKLIYFSAAFSFLFGDLLMGIGQNKTFWIIAALAASVPIPFITAGQNVILYNSVPKEMQGRVFSVRNAIQFFTIPIGTLLGGSLADYIFEPFMRSSTKLSYILQEIVGTGNGSGMAVMFVCTGILGFITCIIWYRNKQIQKLRNNG